MMSVTVRMAKESELDDAKSFIRSIFPDAMVQITEDDTLLLAEHNDKVVGFAHLIDMGDKMVLQGIGVDPSVRGHGVGTILLEHVLESLSDTDMPIYLKVKSMNPAVELYSRYGFMLKRFGDVHVLVKKPNA
ncbi:MAG: GNAT family N-acetyltransferase [Candidatus Micrarchaeota archaeon]